MAEMTSMEILERIFGSTGKVKLMRLFLFNPHTAYSVKTIAEKIQMSPAVVRTELANLVKISLVKRRVQRTPRSHIVYFLNERFPFVNQLAILLINTSELLQGNVQKRIMKAGKVKLLIVSGIFTQTPDGRVDMLIVGDNIKKRSLFNIIKTIESEIGKEIRYAAFETSDFNYRISVYDKLIRDILDFPHERLIDKLDVK